jgi:outer membrane protein assembly factor BamD
LRTPSLHEDYRHSPALDWRRRSIDDRALADLISRIVIACALLLWVGGCVGSMPSIPNNPEAVLARGDKYFKEEKYFQSIELYKNFTSRYPGHDQSDYAQFKLAESYFKDGQYPVAAVEYQILLGNYNYSDYVDDALFKIGLCFYNESPKPPRDQQKAHDALSRLNQFLQTYPNSDLADEARDYITLLHAKLAEKEFQNAKYYFKRKKMRAALIYFDKIIEKYPDNAFWARALFYKGVILQQKGEKDEAMRYIAQVLAYPEELDVKEEARERLEKMRQ